MSHSNMNVLPWPRSTGAAEHVFGEVLAGRVGKRRAGARASMMMEKDVYLNSNCSSFVDLDFFTWPMFWIGDEVQPNEDNDAKKKRTGPVHRRPLPPSAVRRASPSSRGRISYVYYPRMESEPAS
jgi:hypothetical protein